MSARIWSNYISMAGISLCAAFALLVLSERIALAQTADEQTPAEESICDVLLDGTYDTLWGLCNAFCEAKDCDGLLKLDKSCSQLLNNFEKRSGGKVSMPCLEDNICVDVFGTKHTRPVKDCTAIKYEEECSGSFQPAEACQKVTGNDASACVWSKEGCLAGISVDKRYCCEDLKEKSPSSIEEREADPAYWVEPAIE